MMMTVYLSHGLESGPGALKMQAMKGVTERLEDCEPVVMDYRGMAEPEPVIERARLQRLSLRMLDDDHRLHDSLDTILSDFERFLRQCSSSTQSDSAGTS